MVSTGKPMKKVNGELVAVMANQVARARHALKVQEQLEEITTGLLSKVLEIAFPGRRAEEEIPVAKPG